MRTFSAVLLVVVALGLTGCGPNTDKAYGLCVTAFAPAGSSDEAIEDAEDFCNKERQADPEVFNAKYLYG